MKNKTKHELYVVYQSMISRCLRPYASNYKWYGAKGIKICERWLGKEGFKNFVHDVGPKPSNLHSLDRLNNEGPYEPTNCKWSTNIEQANNRKSNIKLTFKGKVQGISEWARELKLSRQLISMRLKKYGIDNINLVLAPV